MAQNLSKKERKEVREVFIDLREHRKSTGLTQTQFWERYGVSQSSGSRHESETAGMYRPMDTALKALMILHVTGRIDDALLNEAVTFAKSVE